MHHLILHCCWFCLLAYGAAGVCDAQVKTPFPGVSVEYSFPFSWSKLISVFPAYQGTSEELSKELARHNVISLEIHSGPKSKLDGSVLQALDPSDDLASLGLHDLPLDERAFQQLGTLTKELKYLELRRNQFAPAHLRYLKDVPSLESFDLSSDKVTDLHLEQAISEWSLVYLTLRGARIKGSFLAKMKELPEVEFLTIHSSGFQDANGRHLAKCRKLLELDLSDCPRVSHLTLKTLGKLQTLQKLTLDGTSISDDSLSHLLKLKSLKELSISHCKKLTTEAVDILAEHPSLETITAIGLSWSEEDVKQLNDSGEGRFVVTKPVPNLFGFEQSKP
jgi:hypothetical protein